jgi:membrane protein YdbS with pleckstrin-like domain
MAYPTNLIQDGETVALDLRPHWWYFSRNILTGIPLAIVFILMANHVDNSGVTAALWWIMIAVVLAWAGWLVIKYFQWTMTYFVVTSRRVIYRTGVLSKRGVEIPLERVMNINFHQRLIDRIIGAGDLDIESAGKDGQTHFDFVRHPDGVQHEIYRQMEVRNMPQGGFSAPTASAASVPPPAQAPAPGAGPATAAAAPAVSIPDQIEQLANLRDAGRITPEEYEQKKAELLDRM